MAKRTNADRRIDFGDAPEESPARKPATLGLALSAVGSRAAILAAFLPMVTVTLAGESVRMSIPDLVEDAVPFPWPPFLWLALGGLVMLVLLVDLRTLFAFAGGGGTSERVLAWAAGVASAAAVGGWVWSLSLLGGEITANNPDLELLVGEVGALSVHPSVGFWLLVAGAALVVAGAMPWPRGRKAHPVR